MKGAQPTKEEDVHICSVNLLMKHRRSGMKILRPSWSSPLAAETHISDELGIGTG